ncbi:MAG: T9SS type A sorting domain-containing protein, partial [Polaribacter sp.]
WLVFLLVFIAFNFTNAQSVPKPIINFPLNGTNPVNWIDKDGIQHIGKTNGRTGITEDRFGNPEGATKFYNDSYIYQGDYVPVINSGTDVTVSFWTKLYNNHTYPSGTNHYHPGTSLKKRFFSLSTDYKSGGLARIDNNAILGIERFLNTRTGTTEPFYLWMFQPTMMEQIGWYQIVAVMATNYTKIYVYKPDGTKTINHSYFTNNFAKRLAIGKKDSYSSSEELVQPASVMDDLKVWDVALTEAQVNQLNMDEKLVINSHTPYTIQSVTTGNYAYKSTHYQDLDNKVLMANSSKIRNIPQFTNQFYFHYVGNDSRGYFYRIVSKFDGKSLELGYSYEYGDDAVMIEESTSSNSYRRLWYVSRDPQTNHYKITNRFYNKSWFNDTERPLWLRCQRPSYHTGKYRDFILTPVSSDKEGSSVNSSFARSANVTSNELLETDKEIVEESIKIYPNPLNGSLNIYLNLEQSDTVNFDFYDLQGRQVYSENRKVTQGNQTVTLKGLKDRGFSKNQSYLLKITTSTGKVIISKVLFE